MPSTSPRRRINVADIGGSHITAAVVEIDAGTSGGASGTVIASAGRDTDPHGSAAEILGAWAEACRTALAEAAPCESAPIEAAEAAPAETGGNPWAIAMPDPFDFERGTGTFSNVGKFEHLAGLDLRGGLASRLGSDPASVRFLHDAAAYGIGEWMFGAASGHDRAVCITLGTGVGSSFLDGGVPVTDRPDVPTNGTVHLLTIDGEPLEDTVSTRAIVRAYAARTGETTTVRTIAERTRAGESAAGGVLETTFLALGEALSPWLAAFDASVLVAGGSISRSWDLIEPAFRAGIARSSTDLAGAIDLRASTLRDEAPLLGAAGWFTRSAS